MEQAAPSDNSLHGQISRQEASEHRGRSDVRRRASSTNPTSVDKVDLGPPCRSRHWCDAERRRGGCPHADRRCAPPGAEVRPLPQIQTPDLAASPSIIRHARHRPLYDELHVDLRPRLSNRGPPPVARRAPTASSRRNGAPQQLIVSTQYDSALERAFDEAGEPYDVVSYVSVGRDRGKFLHRSAEGDARVIHVPNAYRGRPDRATSGDPEDPRRGRPSADARKRELRRSARTTTSPISPNTGLGGVLPVTLGRAAPAKPLLVPRLRPARLEPPRVPAPALVGRAGGLPVLGGPAELPAPSSAEFWKRRGVDPAPARSTSSSLVLARLADDAGRTPR